MAGISGGGFSNLGGAGSTPKKEEGAGEPVSGEPSHKKSRVEQKAAQKPEKPHVDAEGDSATAPTKSVA